MIKLNVLQILDDKKRTKYWLYKKLDMSYQNFNRMVNNETRSIRYDSIDKLCEVLECSPKDLFVMDQEQSN